MNDEVKDKNALVSALKKRNVDESTYRAVMSSIFPGASPQSAIMAIDYCKARKLDIMKKPCHIVPMQVKDARTGEYEWRDVIMPSIAEQRITAARTGEYAGQDEPKLGDMVELDIGGQKVMAPEFATVTVYRVIQGDRVPFSHTEWFEEACATKKNGTLNAMWSKRKRGQLIKCAEAGALRKAFPEEMGGMHTAEEMEGKVIDGTAEVVEDDAEDATVGASGIVDRINGEKKSPDGQPDIDDDFVREMNEAESANVA